MYNNVLLYNFIILTCDNPLKIIQNIICSMETFCLLFTGIYGSKLLDAFKDVYPGV